MLNMSAQLGMPKAWTCKDSSDMNYAVVFRHTQKVSVFIIVIGFGMNTSIQGKNCAVSGG
jgi:hypothetical protein